MAVDYYLFDRRRNIAVLVGAHYGLFLNQTHWRTFFYASIEDEEGADEGAPAFKVELVTGAELDELNAGGKRVLLVHILPDGHRTDDAVRGRRAREEQRSLRPPLEDAHGGLHAYCEVCGDCVYCYAEDDCGAVEGRKHSVGRPVSLTRDLTTKPPDET